MKMCELNLLINGFMPKGKVTLQDYSFNFAEAKTETKLEADGVYGNFGGIQQR